MFRDAPAGAPGHERAGNVALSGDHEDFSLARRFSTGFSQTRPMLTVSHLSFRAPRPEVAYAGARFGARFSRLWQNTAMPTAAAKLLNPRYMQIESRNARFKTEIDPSMPARK